MKGTLSLEGYFIQLIQILVALKFEEG